MQLAIIYRPLPAILAMFIAWLAGYAYFAIRSVHFSSWGYVNNFTFIFNWTGIFALISSLIFVPLLLKLITKTSFITNKAGFLLAVLLCSQLALILLLLPFLGFHAFLIGKFYFGYAAVIGIVFGLIYPQLQSLHLFSKRGWTAAKLLAFTLMPLFLAFLFYGFPYLTPSLAYTYFGDSIKDRAARSVLAHHKIGDKLSNLQQELPRLIGNEDACQGCTGSLSAEGYELAYKDGVITELAETNRD